MPSNVDLVNRALATIGTRSQITSMTDGSTEALYANLLYSGLRDFMLREGDYDWSAATTPLAPSPLLPSVPWGFTYNYPNGAIRIRQLHPRVYDIFNPEPIAWNVISFGPSRYIATTVECSVVIYTFPVSEDIWDSIFTESFVRLLGSSLAFALENRIEASNAKLSEALSFANIANMRDA